LLVPGELRQFFGYLSEALNIGAEEHKNEHPFRSLQIDEVKRMLKGDVQRTVNAKFLGYDEGVDREQFPQKETLMKTCI
jgi:hypothetical protein